MRVLMFGWEFPPYISGGLGTACYGLSKSLVQENIDLTFVVPTLHGAQQSDPIKIISASEVFIPSETSSNISPSASKVTRVRKVKKVTRRVKHHQHLKTASTIHYIEVNAQLDPYGEPSLTQKTFAEERWNYVFGTSTDRREIITHSVRRESDSVTPIIGYRYNFTGGYGPALLEEAHQYSIVAGELASNYPHDVIHAHDWMTFPAGIEARRRSGKPLVLHVHATEYDRSGSTGGPIFEMERRSLFEADKVISVSEWTKDILVSKYGVAAEKIAVVHNGILLDQNNGVSERGPQIASHVVTFLGRITYQKGPGYFVEAAKKVSERFPDAHFLVAGSGDLLPQTIERVAQLHLSRKFHFTGFLNKEWIERIWSISSVYVMPSVSEPFGITPLEAIRAGVPVVVSKQSGVAEVMPHALTANFWDTNALADCICGVLKHKSLSAMMRQGAEEKIKHLSWKNAALKLKDIYEELAFNSN